MTLQNLKYVVAVAEYGSFSAAAKALYISQSTLSSAIKELEAELGTQLFLRSNRGIQPTPDGEDFLRYAREIVEQSRALERRYRHRRYAPTRFAVSTQRLPFAVRAFQRFMEQLSWNSYDIAIRECPTYTIISDVAAGKSDVGVVALHDQYIPALEKTFEINHVTFTELERLPTYAFLRRSHPLAKRDKVSMAELLQYPFVTYDQEADRSEYTEEVVFHQIAEKTVHVSDRCSKVALVRFTDAFSISISANKLLDEAEAPKAHEAEQMDLFTDYAVREAQEQADKAAHTRERKLQEAMLGIKKRYGKNAILKGMNLEDGATAKERNQTIGGHQA